MASGQVSPKVGKVIDIPANAPTIGTATAGVSSASVAFTAGSTSVGGPVFSYKVLSNPGSVIATGTTSPITVSGLTPDTSYTFTVAGTNPSGSSAYSSASNSITALGTAFESIATATGTGSSNTITFSSIPSTYKHLQIRFLATSTTAGSSYSITFNGDTSNISSHRINAANSTITAAGAANANSSWAGIYYGDNTTYYTAGIIDLIDYANTSKYKTISFFSGVNTNSSAANNEITLSSKSWRSTSAITTLAIGTNGTAWATGSTFALYGIKG